ncbi:118_t:CDS:2 [Funneliformis caledonium]|uniref:118_t:CDS:1 n=1 Tax=Funneliformis caledonium TaxID=1117310 RepID=A0A9N9DMC3_9GLOM|nr:118_t:CDS:2 [Funneliformis caledonium]
MENIIPSINVSLYNGSDLLFNSYYDALYSDSNLLFNTYHNSLNNSSNPPIFDLYSSLHDSSSNPPIFELYDSSHSSSDLLFETYKETQIENEMINTVVRMKFETWKLAELYLDKYAKKQEFCFHKKRNFRQTPNIVQLQGPKQKYGFSMRYVKKALDLAIQTDKVDEFVDQVQHKGRQPNRYKSCGESLKKKAKHIRDITNITNKDHEEASQSGKKRERHYKLCNQIGHYAS